MMDSVVVGTTWAQGRPGWVVRRRQRGQQTDQYFLRACSAGRLRGADGRRLSGWRVKSNRGRWSRREHVRKAECKEGGWIEKGRSVQLKPPKQSGKSLRGEECGIEASYCAEVLSVVVGNFKQKPQAAAGHGYTTKPQDDQEHVETKNGPVVVGCWRAILGDQEVGRSAERNESLESPR